MMLTSETPERDDEAALRLRAAELEAEVARMTEALATERARSAETIASLRGERDRIRIAYANLKEELELLKRRIFVATAERVDTRQLKLEFATKLRALEEMAGTLGDDSIASSDDAVSSGVGKKKRDGRKNPSAKPKGRRRIEDAALPVVVVEVKDDLFEQLVSEGKAECIGFDDSHKLGYERGGLRDVVTRRMKYRAVNSSGAVEIEIAPVPAEVIPKCLATADVLAHVATSKFCDGLPLYRIEQIYERLGFALDRGTMSRWMETIGATLGATIVHAAREHALATAFCIATDATGFAIQPAPSDDGSRRPCRKGHYFVLLADRDHVFFEFKAKETSAEVRAMFRGFEGYVQADAKSVYDALYRVAAPDDPDDDGCDRIEVGCWSHSRRKFWEAAFGGHPVAREALVRIGRIFELDATYRNQPPSRVRELRDRHLRPHVDAFFAFAEPAYEKVRHARGSLRSALGYAVRQRDALGAFLEDGRLRLDNNLAENALRKVVMIRDSALFAGSDEHAESAGHILSLIASARLHGLDPLAYLRDVLRLVPFWPKARFLELAPKFWIATRARLDARQLDAAVGVIDVPDLVGA